ncbi:hypothetical protein LSTR_LSTR014074 [Laodelphax striatellus]|uniref:Uncharacterized protein n=1 Tax=Laodelphax striatellus TaxID=195883 RepID=A0A482WL69_LAOST|nr:hypothetical protein LSTR_LSTR014074 [Laodelphax striatellus]
MVGWFQPIRRDYALLSSAQHSCVLTNELFAVDSTTLLLQPYLSAEFVLRRLPAAVANSKSDLAKVGWWGEEECE